MKIKICTNVVKILFNIFIPLFTQGTLQSLWCLIYAMFSTGDPIGKCHNKEWFKFRFM